jgi:hypothetical protein
VALTQQSALYFTLAAQQRSSVLIRLTDPSDYEVRTERFSFKGWKEAVLQLPCETENLLVETGQGGI